jgi:hypothetical protein
LHRIARLAVVGRYEREKSVRSSGAAIIGTRYAPTTRGKPQGRRLRKPVSLDAGTGAGPSAAFSAVKSMAENGCGAPLHGGALGCLEKVRSQFLSLRQPSSPTASPHPAYKPISPVLRTFLAATPYRLMSFAPFTFSKRPLFSEALYFAHSVRNPFFLFLQHFWTCDSVGSSSFSRSSDLASKSNRTICHRRVGALFVQSGHSPAWRCQLIAPLADSGSGVSDRPLVADVDLRLGSQAALSGPLMLLRRDRHHPQI